MVGTNVRTSELAKLTVANAPLELGLDVTVSSLNILDLPNCNKINLVRTWMEHPSCASAYSPFEWDEDAEALSLSNDNGSSKSYPNLGPTTTLAKGADALCTFGWSTDKGYIGCVLTKSPEMKLECKLEGLDFFLGGEALVSALRETENLLKGNALKITSRGYDGRLPVVQMEVDFQDGSAPMNYNTLVLQKCLGRCEEPQRLRSNTSYTGTVTQVFKDGTLNLRIQNGTVHLRKMEEYLEIKSLKLFIPKYTMTEGSNLSNEKLYLIVKDETVRRVKVLCFDRNSAMVEFLDYAEPPQKVRIPQLLDGDFVDPTLNYILGLLQAPATKVHLRWIHKIYNPEEVLQMFGKDEWTFNVRHKKRNGLPIVWIYAKDGKTIINKQLVRQCMAVLLTNK